MNQVDGSHIPRCTYRLQLGKDFGFPAAAALVDYLAELGVSHCYASPFFKARPGSCNGYDIVDPNDFNPEIGREASFKVLVESLQEKGLNLLVDVVPNHLGVMGNDNEWWLDVLENGPASKYSDFFDIDWQPLKKNLRNRLLVPVLGDHYGRELEAGHLRVVFEVQRGWFCIRYFHHLFPLDPRTYPLILRRNLSGLTEKLGSGHPDLLVLHEILEYCNTMPGRRVKSTLKMQQRRQDGKIIKRKLVSLIAESPAVAAHISENLKIINGNPGDRAGFAELHRLLERQVFRLSFWKVAAEEINYRRFFDINDLAGIRIEEEKVFHETHRLLFRLVEEGMIAGLRIDHIDGLYDPAGYLKRLHHQLQSLQPHRPLYLVVEKILAGNEQLPEDWPVHGTTGYDFAGQVDALLLYPSSFREINATYRRMTGDESGFGSILRISKKIIMERSLTGELNVLANRLNRLSESDWRNRDFTLNSLRQALTELIASFRVYRTYITDRTVSDADKQIIKTAVQSAKLHNPGTDHTIFDFIESLLLQRADFFIRSPGSRAMRDFTMRFQQVTAPVVAKGMEDTAFYRYNRFLALNDVGHDPDRFGLARDDFHRCCQQRSAGWPNTMLATSTHDSKRSEDVRARLNVLSEAAGEWRKAVSRWRRMNSRLKLTVSGHLVPDANEEYHFYQTLFGFFPLSLPDRSGWLQLQERLAAYMLKTVREAKGNTSWRNPNEEYESALLHFVEKLYTNTRSAFWTDFCGLHRRLAVFGLYNSLSQNLLKLTLPGVPDIFQGCELWNFTLVDPDNRRPVDFSIRRRLLHELPAVDGTPEILQQEIEKMSADMTDGRIKMYVIRQCLALRNKYSLQFAEGNYSPLAVQGRCKEHVVAFTRQFEDQFIAAVAPRFFYRLVGGDHTIIPQGDVWLDTAVLLPGNFGPVTLVSQFTGEEFKVEKSEGHCLLPVKDLLGKFPVNLLSGIHQG